MKAIKIIVSAGEVDKMDPFLEAVNATEALAGAEVGCVKMFVAADSVEWLEYVKAQLPHWFKEYKIITIK